MKERPILMNSFSVKAILAGKKTQTRCVIEPQPPDNHWWNADAGTMILASQYYPSTGGRLGCPYGTVGDHLLAPPVTLEITDVRVERVREITEADAIAEGWNPESDLFPTINREDKTLAWFRRVWNGINAKRGYGWNANPWVWVVEFKRI